MNPRYFATYRNLRSREADPIEVFFGRFYDYEAATHRAKEAYDVEGYGELISVRQETLLEARSYRISRFFIRTIRIVFASAFALFLFAWLTGSGTNIGDIPFSSITPNMMFSSVFRVVLGIGAACLCWFIAFGDGPDR